MAHQEYLGVDCLNLKEIHGTQSNALEEALITSPEFLRGELRLLCGVSPREVTRGDPPPPRSDDEWDEPLLPYLVCREDRVLELLTMEEQMSVDPRRAEPPSGSLRLACKPGQERGVLALLAPLEDKMAHDPPLRCDLAPLPEEMEPHLLRLRLVQRIPSATPPLFSLGQRYKGPSFVLRPTPFGQECGLVRCYEAKDGQVSYRILCSPRTLTYLDALVAAWPPVPDPVRPSTVLPLARRTERTRQGFFCDPYCSQKLIEALCQVNTADYLNSLAGLSDHQQFMRDKAMRPPFSTSPRATLLETMEGLYHCIQKSSSRTETPCGTFLNLMSAPLIPPERRN